MTTIEKIRTEIEQLKTKPLPFDGYDECVKYALHIIDKYAEQEPKQKTGNWIGADSDNAICSCCNRLNRLYGDYCKHCGARMESEK